MSLAETRRLPGPTGSKRVESPRLAELAARVTTTGGEREELEIENPAAGTPLGTVPRCTAEDVELAVQRARVAQGVWASTDWAEREAILMRVHDLVLDRQTSCST
jgi:succinate-semialdehyde dehydrogenase / glutarate-semialdehyde dehydrogenase